MRPRRCSPPRGATPCAGSWPTGRQGVPPCGALALWTGARARCRSRWPRTTACVTEAARGPPLLRLPSNEPTPIPPGATAPLPALALKGSSPAAAPPTSSWWTTPAAPGGSAARLAPLASSFFRCPAASARGAARALAKGPSCARTRTCPARAAAGPPRPHPVAPRRALPLPPAWPPAAACTWPRCAAAAACSHTSWSS
jgi:hypothetical protein